MTVYYNQEDAELTLFDELKCLGLRNKACSWFTIFDMSDNDSNTGKLGVSADIRESPPMVIMGKPHAGHNGTESKPTFINSTLPPNLEDSNLQTLFDF